MTTRPPRRRWPPALRVGAAITLIWVILALLADVIAPFPPNTHNMEAILQPPGATHWLGTDNFGRDVLSRILHGTRIDLLMGVVGVLIPFVIGVSLGAIAGCFGGVLDVVLMRIRDVVLALPWLAARNVLQETNGR